MQYFVYIIYSTRINKYYIGYSSNIQQRLSFHNDGKSRYTKSGTPWELKHIEGFQTKTEAIQREKKLKAMKSRKYIEWLIESKK